MEVFELCKNFFKVYHDFIPKANELTISEMRLFFHLSSIMQFGSNSILWEKAIREHIASVMNISGRSLTNLMSRLRKKGFIFRNGFWVILNEKYVKKGE